MPIPEFENDPPTERTRAIRRDIADHTKAANRNTIALSVVVGLTVAIAAGIVVMLVLT